MSDKEKIRHIHQKNGMIILRAMKLFNRPVTIKELAIFIAESSKVGEKVISIFFTKDLIVKTLLAVETKADRGRHHFYH
jgi:hypothetical protein